jgi:outer membrane protein TolC
MKTYSHDSLSKNEQMKKNIYWCLIPLIIFLLNNTKASAKEPAVVKKLSFDQALEITYQNSHTLKQAEYFRKQKEQEAKAAKSLFFPNIGITAQYVAMSDPIQLDLTDVRDVIVPLYQTLSKYGKFGDVPGLTDDIATQVIRGKLAQGLGEIENSNWNQMIQKKQFGTVDATFQWPLFTGGKILAANKAANIGKKDAGENSRVKEGEVITELVERYYGLCIAQQAVKVRNEVLNGLQQHLEDAEKMENEGLISHTDVLHAHVFQAQALRELSKARQTEDIINQALQSTLVIDDSTKIDPASELFYLDSIEPESHFAELARDNNPLLNQVEIKKQLAIQNSQAEKANYYPTVALQGAYDIVNKDLSPYAPDWYVGIGLQWTLFDWTERVNKVKSASFQTKQVEEVQEKAKSDVITLIDKLYHELNMYHEQLIELESSQKYADDYLLARDNEFHQDITNSTEVVDARLALAKVKIERLEVLYDYDLTLAKILEVAGVPQTFNAYYKKPGVKMESYQ